MKTLFIHYWLVFLLQCKLLQALNEGNITLLFVSYLLPKAKRSQRTFKWALQPFMVLRIKTPGTNEEYVSVGCRPHVSASRICSAFQHIFFFFLFGIRMAFVTAGCFAFICHRFCWNTAKTLRINCIYYKLWLNVCSSGEETFKKGQFLK